MQTTVQTRLDLRDDDQRLAGVLDAYSELMNRVERTLHARLRAGRKWTGDLAVSLYKDFDISAKLMESAYSSLQGKMKSVSELLELHAAELSEKIEDKQNEIDQKEKKVEKRRANLRKALDQLHSLDETIKPLKAKLDKAKPSQQPKALQRYKSELGKLHGKRAKIASFRDEITCLKRELHQHKRRLAVLQHKHAKMLTKVEDPSICFGTKKLFKAQHHLQENGFASHSAWKESWRAARSTTFIIEGEAAASQGNRFAKLYHRKDGLFDLELRLPEALKHLAEQTMRVGGSKVHIVWLKGLRFHRHIEALTNALSGKTPISIRFHRDETSWRVLVAFRQSIATAQENYSSGAIGVDLNAGFVSVSRVDRHGNLVETFDVVMETYGKTKGQSASVVKQAAAEIAAYAERYDLPVVSEWLDFLEKKRQLKDKSPRYARMLSSFVYSSFDAALASACARSGIFHRRVDPAYTSIIGRVKFASRYGLSVHAAAAIAIARRAMKLSERLPLSFTEKDQVSLPLNDAHRVTLDLPARKDTAQSQAVGTRHVRSDWKRVNRAFRSAVAPRRPSKRKQPLRSIGRNDLHSMVCRRRKDVLKVSTQSPDQRVGPDAIGGKAADAPQIGFNRL